MNKALIFPKLSIISSLVSCLMRSLFKTDIFYIELSRYFINKPFAISLLENRSIKWIKKEYSLFSEYSKGDFFSYDITDKVHICVKDAHLINVIERKFSISGNLKKKMDVVWKKNIHLFVEQFAHQCAAAEFLIERKGYERVIIICYSSLIRLFRDYYKNQPAIKIFVFGGLITVDFCCRILSNLFTVSRIKNINVFFRRIPKKGEEKNNIQQVRPEDFKIAYFPHQGVFFGNFFIKDQFYSDNANSPLYKSRILHISINEKNSAYMLNSYKFYDENRIPYIDTCDLDNSYRKILIECIALLMFSPLKTFIDFFKFGSDYISMVLFTFFTLKKYLYIVAKMPNLKFALVGYEILFPRELSLVLGLRGAKVCATQERFITAFSPEKGMSYFMLDYYFVGGEIVIEKGLKRHYIENCIPIGLVRAENLYEYEKENIYDEKYDSIKSNRKMVVALDYPLPENDIEDITRQVGKVQQLRKFYSDLIKLADEFPLLYIVIKGKGTETYKSSYIKDIMSEIYRRENITIETDLKKYNPSFLIEKADLTIACQTSLCDELLAAGRKIIFYELSDYLETCFNYENLPIIVKNYEQLKCSIQNYLDGRYLSDDIIKNIMKRFYSNCYDGKVRKRIVKILEKIINQ